MTPFRRSSRSAKDRWDGHGPRWWVSLTTHLPPPQEPSDHQPRKPVDSRGSRGACRRELGNIDLVRQNGVVIDAADYAIERLLTAIGTDAQVIDAFIAEQIEGTCWLGTPGWIC